MLSLSCDHPDLEEFIEVKSDLSRVTKANISVRITDEFMEAVKNKRPFELSFTRQETGETITKTIDAAEIFHKICKMNWDYAEPGMLFWDRIKSWNLLSEDKNFQYAGVNPCFGGDMELLTTEGYKTFKELEGTEPYIYNVNGNVVKSKVWCSGEKETVKIKTKNDEIICTPEHKFMTIDGNECQAKDLKDKHIQLYQSDNMDENYVISVESNGIQKVYDFTEPETHWGVVNDCVVHNCAEEPLPAGGSCLLGSINLAAFVKPDKSFDMDDFEQTVNIAVGALNDVLDEGLPLHPLQEQRDSVKHWRQIGLGIMGLADMLIKMGIRYGSKESIEFCDQLGYKMANSAIYTSADLSATDGKYSGFDGLVLLNSKYFQKHIESYNQKQVATRGLHNSQLLTIPPTGTISSMIGVSSGIEPIYATHYTRKTESLHGHDEYYKVYTPIVKEYMEAHGLQNETQLPNFFVTAQNLDYKKRIDMQAVWQSHIDASISSTVNVPNSFTVEETEDLYMYAWEKGLKGVTIYRDGCKRAGILTTDDKKDNKEENKEEKSNDVKKHTNVNRDKDGKEIYELQDLKRGMIIKADDNCIGRKRTLTTGCGTLHCEAFFDPVTGDLLETFLSKGSKGICNSYMIGLSRMISLAARGGVDVYSIIDQLLSVPACPAYASRAAVHHDTSKGSCCPVAIGNALIDMYEKLQEELNAEDENEMKDTTKYYSVVNKPFEEKKDVAICPECGSALVFEGGCNTCKNCGWSKCD